MIDIHGATRYNNSKGGNGMLHYYYVMSQTYVFAEFYAFNAWIFFFAVQLLLCFLVSRRRFLKLVPLIFLLTEWVDIGIFYFSFDISSLYEGVASESLSHLIGASSMAVLCAWLIYGLFRAGKKVWEKIEVKKVIRSEKKIKE